MDSGPPSTAGAENRDKTVIEAVLEEGTTDMHIDNIRESIIDMFGDSISYTEVTLEGKVRVGIPETSIDESLLDNISSSIESIQSISTIS